MLFNATGAGEAWTTQAWDTVLLVSGHSQLQEIHITVPFVSLNMPLPLCHLLETEGIFVRDIEKTGTSLASVENDTSFPSLSHIVSLGGDHGS